MKSALLSIGALFFALLLSASGADEQTSNLSLKRQGKEIDLPAPAMTQVRKQLWALLRSSNFSSGPDARAPYIERFPTVQKDYRDALVGAYLLLTLSAPLKVKTIGGEVEVLEIVFGLHRPGNNTLFTIDNSNRIVSHAKYEGMIWLELEKIVKPLLP